MSSRLLTTAALLSLPSLCGCLWHDDTRYDFPVFSDDAQAVAAVLMTYERRRGITHDDERDHWTAVVTAPATATLSPSVLSEPVQGEVTELFFMNSEGYLVLGWEGDDVELDEGGLANDIGYEQIALDGTITPLGEGHFQTHYSCDGGWTGWDAAVPLRFIPSPDGTVLAKFEVETSCSERTLQVTLLDADGGGVLAGPFEVPDREPESLSSGPQYVEVDVGWTEDGAFAVGLATQGAGGEAYEATLYRVDADPQAGVPLTSDCFHPPTSSGATNADDQTLVIDEETGEIWIDPGESGRVFGCED